jgi:hypothetical protein
MICDKRVSPGEGGGGLKGVISGKGRARNAVNLQNGAEAGGVGGGAHSDKVAS